MPSYKVEFLPSHLVTSTGQTDKAAQAMEARINARAAEGWVLDQVAEIAVTENPGCLRALLGAKGVSVNYNCLIFRSPDAPTGVPRDEGAQAEPPTAPASAGPADVLPPSGDPGPRPAPDAAAVALDVPQGLSADELLRIADQARGRGDIKGRKKAVYYYRAFVVRYPGDIRLPAIRAKLAKTEAELRKLGVAV